MLVYKEHLYLINNYVHEVTSLTFLIWKQVWFTKSKISSSSSSLKTYVLLENNAFSCFVSIWPLMDDPSLSTLRCPFKSSNTPTKPFFKSRLKIRGMVYPRVWLKLWWQWRQVQRQGHGFHLNTWNQSFEMQSKGIHIPQKGALAFLLVKSTLLDIHVFLVLKGK